jgi:poly-gamma-glutamate capsule biosynthesis protein CapA/YwtB (metallophosphatase superfamily)
MHMLRSMTAGYDKSTLLGRVAVWKDGHTTTMSQTSDGSVLNGPETVSVFLSGDVMTGRGVDQILGHPSGPRLYEPYVKNARDYVKLAEVANGPIRRPVEPAWIWGEALGELDRWRPDARIVNLETSITVADKYWRGKHIHYRMHPDNVGCLTAGGLDACMLANNHVLDFGYSGLAETLQTLRESGIKTAGAGLDLDEARRPAIIDMSSLGRIVVASVASPSSGVPGEWAAAPTRPGVNLVAELSEQAAREVAGQLAEAKRPGDIGIVSIHWGSNWGYDVPAAHVRFAHELIDAGVDLVHGHSSHHPRPIEVYKRRLILYGCGDLLNDYEGITGKESFKGDLALMYLAFLSAGTGELVRLRMIPVRVRRMRLERASQEHTRWLAQILNTASEQFGCRVRLEPDMTLVLDDSF